MATLVGKQLDFTEAMKELLELEYDALEAYKAAISRIKSEDYKLRLEEFKTDHEKHINKISSYLQHHTADVPKGPCSKQWLTKGKVVLANIIGDKGIIEAMKSNELDTNQAYENICSRTDKWPEIKSFLEDALGDEKRHKACFSEIADM